MTLVSQFKKKDLDIECIILGFNKINNLEAECIKRPKLFGIYEQTIRFFFSLLLQCCTMSQVALAYHDTKSEKKNQTNGIGLINRN